MRYTYNTVHSGLLDDGRTERRVDYVPNNVPGMVVWLRDTRFASGNSILAEDRLLSEQSEGPKGGLLVVDSHANPLRGPRDGSVTPIDPVSGAELGRFPFAPNDNWGGRTQATNAAFGLIDTAEITLTAAAQAASPATTLYTPTRYAPLPGVAGFHDAMGYYPGVEELPQAVLTEASGGATRLKRYALSDPDAGAVIPAAGYYAPRTPDGFTGTGAETDPPNGEVSSEETLYTFGEELRWFSVGRAGGTDVRSERTGNPGSRNVHFGFHFEVVGQAEDGSYGVIRIWRDARALELDGRLAEAIAADAPDGKVVVTSEVRNVGGRGEVGVYSSFGPDARLVAAGLSGGAVPVAGGLSVVRRALASGGAASVA